MTILNFSYPFAAVCRQQQDCSKCLAGTCLLLKAGDESFRQEIEQLAAQVRQQLGIERTPTGWRIARPESRG